MPANIELFWTILMMENTLAYQYKRTSLLNIIQMHKCQTATNTLAYYAEAQITGVKSFTGLAQLSVARPL
jgi:hypothetical protein